MKRFVRSLLWVEIAWAGWVIIKEMIAYRRTQRYMKQMYRRWF